MSPIDERKLIQTPQVRPTHSFIEFERQEIEQSIPRRFEREVAIYPGRVAVKKHEQTVTYDALNRMANRIARALFSRSDKKNEPVAVVVENDVLTIAAIIGILKAGKIYVPLDSSFSPAWVNFIVEDTEPAMIIATEKNLSNVRGWLNSRQSFLDIESLDPRLSDNNLELEIPPNAMAHVLYTSGSTGQPKGVTDTHRNTLHYVMRLTNISHISQNDRMTLLRPPSSSGALMNAFLALLNGASLFPMNIKDVGLTGLADWLLQERITVYHSGGTVFHHFAQLLTGKERFPDLRLIRLSSGQVSKADVDLFKQHFADCILLHVLSSTEANTYRVHFVDKNSEISDASLPVGYPVEDMDVLVLDDSGKEMPVNGVGEIAIRSDYLFHGYWRNPELTKAVFVSDPGGRGRRIFRTSDLGRLRPDGCLEYVGRKDFRLKIRGHSIQAEEVEIALLKIPEIDQAAVAAWKDGHGDDRLVAYIAPGHKPLPSISRLRELLKETLPEYMLPTTFVISSSLPLNPNGKVNRQELPLPTKARPELSSPFVEPRTPVEVVVAKIWSEALCVDMIGVHDNFFDLGGDSLLASRVVTTVSRIFPWSLTLYDFFESPTVAKTSQTLAAKEPSPGQADKVARVFLKVESMSAAEISRVVSDERSKQDHGQKKSSALREE